MISWTLALFYIGSVVLIEEDPFILEEDLSLAPCLLYNLIFYCCIEERHYHSWSSCFTNLTVSFPSLPFEIHTSQSVLEILALCWEIHIAVNQVLQTAFVSHDFEPYWHFSFYVSGWLELLALVFKLAGLYGLCLSSLLFQVSLRVLSLTALCILLFSLFNCLLRTIATCFLVVWRATMASPEVN